MSHHCASHLPQVGVAPLTFWESRAHLGLWVLMAQPLHIGMDIRNASAEYVDLFTNPDLLAAAGDPLVKMGFVNFGCCFTFHATNLAVYLPVSRHVLPPLRQH